MNGLIAWHTMVVYLEYNELSMLTKFLISPYKYLQILKFEIVVFFLTHNQESAISRCCWKKNEITDSLQKHMKTCSGYCTFQVWKNIVFLSSYEETISHSSRPLESENEPVSHLVLFVRLWRHFKILSLAYSGFGFSTLKLCQIHQNHCHHPLMPGQGFLINFPKKCTWLFSSFLFTLIFDK